jgi:hypothetical protein
MSRFTDLFQEPEAPTPADPTPVTSPAPEVKMDSDKKSTSDKKSKKRTK